MSNMQPIISRLLVQILSQSSQPGARLKQRLNQALVANGYMGLNEKYLGYKKFARYLESEHCDTVVVIRPDGIGDVTVSLRSQKSVPYIDTNQTPLRSIRNDFWQAFVNPDPNRVRFFDKTTDRIEHFPVTSENLPKVEEYRSNDSYVEITPIPGDKHNDWMRDFLSTQDLSDAEKSTLEAIASEDYSSKTNNMFVRSLGGHRSHAWKNFRASHVIETILRWTAESGINQSVIYTHQGTNKANCSREPSKHELDAQSLSGNTHQLRPKAQVLKLLDLLSEEDIARVVIPTLLSTIMIKSRL